MKVINDFLAFKMRGVLGLALALPFGAAIFLSRSPIPEDSVADFVMDGLAWLFFLLYVTFRLWATLYIGGRKDKALQTEGPYSVTRNPLYLGSLCFGLSTIFFFDSVLLFIALGLLWAFYSRWVIPAEESYLKEHFREAFLAYCRRTPRLLPSFSLYRPGEPPRVCLKALRTETVRLWIAALVPIFSEVLSHLRMLPWWPNWFTLL